MKRLLSILGLKRGHNSEGEAEFISTFLLPYEPKEFKDMRDDVMAYVITTDPKSKVMFSCHTDTVHSSHRIQIPASLSTSDPILNPIKIKNGFASKDDGEPLGADDGAGVWLMLEMIDAGIPGTYVFHRGEEQGGIGSSWLALNKPEFLSQFNFAIAFDRRGFTDVITHQGGRRGCSDDFAWALAEMLPDGFKPSQNGMFTDTANYFSLIPECTNVSVGYELEHSAKEKLDINFLIGLRDAIVKNFDESLLPVERSCVPEIMNEADILEASYEELDAWVANSPPSEVTNLLYALALKLDDANNSLYDASMTIDYYEKGIDYLKVVDF